MGGRAVGGNQRRTPRMDLLLVFMLRMPSIRLFWTSPFISTIVEKHSSSEPPRSNYRGKLKRSSQMRLASAVAHGALRLQPTSKDY